MTHVRTNIFYTVLSIPIGSLPLPISIPYCAYLSSLEMETAVSCKTLNSDLSDYTISHPRSQGHNLCCRASHLLAFERLWEYKPLKQWNCLLRRKKDWNPQHPDRFWGPPSLLYNGYWGFWMRVITHITYICNGAKTTPTNYPLLHNKSQIGYHRAIYYIFGCILLPPHSPWIWWLQCLPNVGITSAHDMAKSWKTKLHIRYIFSY
jgi:hypothetical protein